MPKSGTAAWDAVRPTPVFGERALLIREEGPEGRASLVIGDLHVGLESELRESGVHLPSQTDRMRDRILALLKETGARRLVILGDLKHEIVRTGWQEAREIPRLVAEVPVPVEVVRGNHDADLLATPGLAVHTALGMRLNDAGLCHGHVWPAERVMAARTVVICHNHPMVLLVDEKGARHKEPCWIRARFTPKAAERYPDLPADAELIVLPAFNELLGGAAVNDPALAHAGGRGPLWSIADLEGAAVFTLDGVQLGSVAELRKFGKGRGRRRERRTLGET
jgi:putative SbcD/Mre11-related phosphoesterase